MEHRNFKGGHMRLSVKMYARILSVCFLSQLVLASPAQASSLLLLNSHMLSLFQSASNQCFIYSYDPNGNRLALSNVTYSSTGAWGSSVYGCFSWTTP